MIWKWDWNQIRKKLLNVHIANLCILKYFLLLTFLNSKRVQAKERVYNLDVIYGYSFSKKSGLLMACCPKAHLTMLLGKIYLSCNEACLQSHTYGVSWFLSSLSVCRWAELLRTQINLVVVGDLSLFRILLRC